MRLTSALYAASRFFLARIDAQKEGEEEEEDDGDNYQESEDESSEEKPKRKASMQRTGSKRGRKGDDSDD